MTAGGAKRARRHAWIPQPIDEVHGRVRLMNGAYDLFTIVGLLDEPYCDGCAIRREPEPKDQRRTAMQALPYAGSRRHPIIGSSTGKLPPEERNKGLCVASVAGCGFRRQHIGFTAEVCAVGYASES